MKKKFLLFSFTFVALALTFMSNSGGRATAGGGDNTGADSGPFCQQCHSGGNFSPAMTIEVYDENTTNAVSEYIAGVIYDVTMEVTADGNQGGFGAQMTCLDGNSNPITSFSSPSSNAQLASLGNGRQYVEQMGISSVGTFTTKWTAPISGTGDITFYAGGIAADGGGSTANDGATKTSFTLSENLQSSNRAEQQLAVSLKVYPNPVETVLNIETVGSTSGQHTLTVTNVAGQVMVNQQLDIDFGMDFTQIDVSNLAQGVYNVTLLKDGKVASTQIIKN